MTAVSIIVCVYNPEERIFSRCLAAIAQLHTGKFSTELVIVDNNSSLPLQEQHYISSLMGQMRFPVSIVKEKKQGLAFARIKGFKTASAPLVIMFDDDNEPDPDYLVNAVDIMQTDPALGIAGPGIVRIDYIDETAEWIKQQLGAYFQEKKIDTPGYSTSKTMWDTFYPPGTGQVIRRSVVNEYMEYFQSGKISAVDRKGESLSSAGDNQLIWSALNLGFKVGQHPLLRVSHLIPGYRSTMSYLKKLSHALRSSGIQALVEMYPEMQSQVVNYRWYKYLYHQALAVANCMVSGKRRLMPIQLAALNGSYDASFKIRKKKNPLLYRMVMKYLLP